MRIEAHHTNFGIRQNFLETQFLVKYDMKDLPEKEKKIPQYSSNTYFVFYFPLKAKATTQYI